MKTKTITLLISVFLLSGTTSHAQSVSANITANVSCNGGNNGAVSLTASGGTTPYTYLWTGGGTNITETGLTAGTYNITLTDYLGNTATGSTTITQPASALSVTASASYTAVCPGTWDNLSASATGGSIPYTYLWTAGAVQGDVFVCTTCANTAVVLPFGNTFTVIVTDANGCTATATVTIGLYPFPYTVISSGPLSPVCPGNPDTLIATGATNYLWSTGATTSSIIVSPASSTSYSVSTSNSYGCIDSAHYAVAINCSGNGSSASNAISVSPGPTCTMNSYSTNDSVVYFSFPAADSNTQVVGLSNFMGTNVAPHIHRVTLYNSSMNVILDESMPDENGANEIRLDANHLTIGNNYYVRISRNYANANFPGNNPTPTPIGEDNASMRWTFELAIRTVSVFVPKDSGSEPPAMSQLYYEGIGQIADLNGIPRFNIRGYTNNASPAVYCTDSAVSFVYQHTDTAKSFIDTFQRVDMVLTGSSLLPPQRMFKMEEDTDAGYLNYYLGFVPNGIRSVYGYSRLVYKNVYNNIDEQIYSNNAGTKFYFVCNPGGGTGGSGGNPSDIELQFNGATAVNVTGSGGLNIVTELGNLNFPPADAYEDSAGVIVQLPWKATFTAVGSNKVKFNTGAYNTAEPLIIRIDRGKSVSVPTSCIDNLCWSTYMGGNNTDWFWGVSTDNSNNTYTTGSSRSSNFPVSPGAFQTKLNGKQNAVIAKFAATTHARDWATYYGGSDIDQGNSIAADASGNVYVTGYTSSPDFPIVPGIGGTYNQPLLNGTGAGPDYDAFIVKLDKDGNVYWSTFYGGYNGGIKSYPNGEVGNHITLDGLGNFYVVGGYLNQILPFATVPTYSVAGAFNSTIGTGWIAKFTTGGVWEWATTIGGFNGSNGGSSTTLQSCAIDASNNLYVTGSASETGYPIVSPGANATYQGGCDAMTDAVVTKFDATTNAIVWSTYYGGDGDDYGYAITTDNAGNVYITGNTDSPCPSISLLTAPGPFNQTHYGAIIGNETPNAFIAEFAPGGTMVWSTYFGKNYNTFGDGIAYDNNSGNLFVTGFVTGLIPVPSSNPPGVYSVLTPTGNNCYIAAFNNWGYLWGTYFGGGISDENTAAVIDGADNLYIVGNTSSPSTSPSFPLVDNPHPTDYFQGTLPSNDGTAFISQFGLSSVVGINNVTNPENEIAVHPNPTSQDIMVQMQLKEGEDVEYVLYNVLGETVYSDLVKENAGTINKKISLSLLPAETYILKVTTGNNVYHQKIVKLQ